MVPPLKGSVPGSNNYISLSGLGRALVTQSNQLDQERQLHGRHALRSCLHCEFEHSARCRMLCVSQNEYDCFQNRFSPSGSRAHALKAGDAK
jgi:hypothetical protein